MVSGLESRLGRRVAVLLIAVLLGHGIGGFPGALAEPVANTPESNTPTATATDNIKTLELGPLSQPVDPNILAQYLQGRIHTQAGKYRLGPGDQLTVSVYDAPEFNASELTVRPDGFISVPALGELEVRNLTIDDAQDLIAERLRAYLLKPVVTVSVKQFRPAVVYVLGEVQRPGVYQYQRSNTLSVSTEQTREDRFEVTLSNLIDHAGGLTSMSDLAQISVVNPGTGRTALVNLWQLILQGDTRQDILLAPGDVVIIPKSEQPMTDTEFRAVSRSTLFASSFPVLVLGQVSKPGKIEMTAQSPSLAAALAQAEGFAQGANRSRILVARPDGRGGYSEIYVDRRKTDFSLLPNDVVYVMETKLHRLDQGVKYITQIVAPYQGVGMGSYSLFRTTNPHRFQNVVP